MGTCVNASVDTNVIVCVSFDRGESTHVSQGMSKGMGICWSGCYHDST